MKQINLPLIWDYIKSFILPILVIILLISQFNSCGNEKKVAEISTRNELLEEEIQVVKGENVSLKAQRDFNARLLSESDERVEQNEKQIAELTAKINANEIKAKKDKEAIKNYNHKDFVNYYNKKFETNLAVLAPNGITLTEDLPLIVANKLIDGDVAQANFKLQTEKYTQLYDNFNEITGQVTILKDENEKLVVALDKTENLLDKSNELGEDAVKQLKKMKFKAKVSQVLVPVGIAVGIITGIIIAK
jgi:hypothetical protein